MKEIQLKESLLKDMNSVIKGLHSMNAKNALGYLFNPTNNGKSIANGMFCHMESEINKNQWTYYHIYKDHITYII